MDSADDVPFAGDGRRSDLLSDVSITDVRITGRDGAGGTIGDALRDVATGGRGGSGGATATGGSGTSGGGGAIGSGGVTGSGGTTGSGGVTGSGGTTGTGGAGGDTVADAAISCVGRQGIDAGTGDTLSQGLVAWYPCEEAPGGSLPDQSGKGNNATLAISGTGGTTGYSFVAGEVKNALALNVASKAYATLPAGILADSCEATVATWVYINTSANWQRVWDFGKDSNVYMFLATTNNVSNVLRFGISISGNTHEERIDGKAPLPTGAWHHLAVVLGPSGGILYLDGVQVGANSSMKLRPADLGSTSQNYIGRSQFSADPYPDGNIDEFRVYDRALSPEEVQALHAGS